MPLLVLGFERIENTAVTRKSNREENHLLPHRHVLLESLNVLEGLLASKELQWSFHCASCVCDPRKSAFTQCSAESPENGDLNRHKMWTIRST